MKKLFFKVSIILFFMWFLSLNLKTMFFGGLILLAYKYRAKIKSWGLIKKVFSVLVFMPKGIKLLYIAFEIARAKRKFKLKGSFVDMLKSAKISSTHICVKSENMTCSFMYAKKIRKFVEVKKIGGPILKIIKRVQDFGASLSPLIKQM